jgi:pimeloyl-ACP methyl ester carboxylesterase
MFVRRFSAASSRWQISFPTVIGWTILLAILFPVDVRGAEEEDEIPAPEDIVLKTGDDLLLHATYLAGTHEKESVPIILLHGFKRDRHDFDALGIYLQKQGHAVIAPDLRGHGDSKEFRHAPGERNDKIEAGTLRQADFAAMIEYDVEAVKGFLKEKNNEGDLNIDKLCVVGSEMGALIAAGWSQRDWAWPPLTTGKQGQDVKALVLISPEANFKGLHMADYLGDPAIRSQVAVLLIAGSKKSQARKEITNLYDGLKRFHPDPEKKDLFKFMPDSSLQGARLISEPVLKVSPAIAEFIALLVKQQYPWAERATPLN